MKKVIISSVVLSTLFLSGCGVDTQTPAQRFNSCVHNVTARVDWEKMEGDGLALAIEQCKLAAIEIPQAMKQLEATKQYNQVVEGSCND